MMSIAGPTLNPTDAYPPDISHDTTKEKKKKRRREEVESNAEGADDGLKEKKKKKKQKKRDIEQEAAEQHPDILPVNEVPSPKKTKSRKDKRKTQIADPSTDDEPQLDLASTSNSQASTAAFLSAIVAAAAGTPDLGATTSQMPPTFPPPMVQNPPYLPYPQEYGYNGSQSIPQPAGPYPSTTFPFSELAFGSNEDVLRALQDLDISKIANVLKTLEEAAAAANVTAFIGQPAFSPIPVNPAPPPTPLGQIPTASDAILGIPTKEPSVQGHRRTLNMGLAIEQGDPNHAHILANKWLNAAKLAELVRTQGLVYKKGKFSAIEEQQLREAIDDYRTTKSLSETDMLDIIFPKNEKNRDNAFWSEITACVPQRPIIAVYHHVRRSHHPLKQQGKWRADEDGLLKQAVADLGQQWEKVSLRVGRMSSDCRDRYRNHIINRDIRVSGAWTTEEEVDLTRIVTEMTVRQGKDCDNDVFWGRVSELMGGKRGRQQCRIKWTDALSKTVKNEGQKPRWSQQDAFILVHKIDSLNVRDDTEIDWKTIPDPQWNLWSAHTLQRRWLTMKRGIKGYEDMTHQEIMDILRVKKAHIPLLPPVNSRRRKERKVTSAAAITDSDLQRDVAAVQGEAGPSSGPGTFHSGFTRDNDADGSTDSDD